MVLYRVAMWKANFHLYCVLSFTDRQDKFLYIIFRKMEAVKQKFVANILIQFGYFMAAQKTFH